MRMTKIALAAAMALCCLPTGVAFSEEGAKAEEVEMEYKDYKIDQVTCREMLKMAGSERDFTMIFMHGFMSGKKNELLFEPGPLAEASDMVLDQCISKPDATVLSIFETVRK